MGVSQPPIAKLESGTVKNLQLRTLVRMVTALGGRLQVEIVPPPRMKGPAGRARMRPETRIPSR